MLIEADGEKREYTYVCDDCGDVFVVGDAEIIMEPWPHFECPKCGCWIEVNLRKIW